MTSTYEILICTIKVLTSDETSAIFVLLLEFFIRATFISTFKISNFMVHFIGPYQCIDQPSVGYIPNYTNVPTHGMMEHTNKSVYATHAGPLSDRYVSSVHGCMPRYDEP